MKFKICLWMAAAGAILASSASMRAEASSSTARPTLPEPSNNTPGASIMIDGNSAPIPSGFVPGSASQVYFGSPTGPLGGSDITGDTFSVSGGGSIDPSINFALGVTDVGAPSTFTFAFTIPLSPSLSGPIFVLSTLGVTLTGSGTTAATITPVFSNLMLNNIGSCAAGVDIGTGFSTPASSSLTESFTAASTFTPSAGCDSSLTAYVSFSGSGGNTGYGLTGLFQVEIPEPMTMSLLGAPAVALACIRRRRGIGRTA